jgi:beta-lactam-binding protein with PASTA domain
MAAQPACQHNSPANKKNDKLRMSLLQGKNRFMNSCVKIVQPFFRHVWLAGLMVTILTLSGYSGNLAAQEEVMVPLLLDSRFNEAEFLLRGLGLSARRLETDDDCSLPSRLNRVRGQYPQAGTMVRRGSTVGLYTCPPLTVSRRQEVPDMNGLDLTRVRRLAQGLGLKLRVSYHPDCYDPFRQGVVMAQEPEPGSVIKRGGLLIARICGPRP